jgi:ribosomal protein L7/L12
MTEVALVLSICAVAMALLAVARAGAGGSEAITAIRLARIEHRLEEVARFAGAPGEPVPSPSTAGRPSQLVLDLLADGRKIEAIKQYRIETHAGLKEAKDAVEAAAATAALGDARSELKIDA